MPAECQPLNYLSSNLQDFLNIPKIFTLLKTSIQQVLLKQHLRTSGRGHRAYWSEQKIKCWLVQASTEEGMILHCLRNKYQEVGPLRHYWQRLPNFWSGRMQSKVKIYSSEAESKLTLAVEKEWGEYHQKTTSLDCPRHVSHWGISCRSESTQRKRLSLKYARPILVFCCTKLEGNSFLKSSVIKDRTHIVMKFFPIIMKVVNFLLLCKHVFWVGTFHLISVLSGQRLWKIVFTSLGTYAISRRGKQRSFLSITLSTFLGL